MLRLSERDMHRFEQEQVRLASIRAPVVKRVVKALLARRGHEPVSLTVEPDDASQVRPVRGRQFTARSATHSAPAGSGRYLSTAQVARMLDVSERTVRKWCEKGLVQAVQPARPKGAWRIVASQFTVTPRQMSAIVRKVRSLNRRLGSSELDDYEG